MTQDSRFGGGRIYEDKKVPCWDCGAWFMLKAEEQKFYDEKGLKPPKRCKECREKRREQKPRE